MEDDEEQSSFSSAAAAVVAAATTPGPPTSITDQEVAVGPVVHWSVGSRLESKSRDSNGGEQWFPAKVLEVEADKILVHYMQWNARHDEWIPSNSSRLRPVTSGSSGRSSRHSSGGCNDLTTENNSVTNNSSVPQVPPPPPAPPAGSIMPAHKDFKPGDKVMATWKLNRKYLATVRRYEPTEGTYLVEFYDGVQCHVKPNNMRKPRKGEEDADHQQETLKVNGVDNESAENSENEDNVIGGGAGVGSSGGGSGSTSRRERKRKFDVKQLFGVRSVKSLRSNSQEESPLEASTPKNNEKRKRRLASQKTDNR